MAAPGRSADGQARSAASPFGLVRFRWLVVAVVWAVACFATAAWQSPYPDPYAPSSQRSARDWFLYPREQSAWKSLPVVSAVRDRITRLPSRN